MAKSAVAELESNEANFDEEWCATAVTKHNGCPAATCDSFNRQVFGQRKVLYEGLNEKPHLLSRRLTVKF